MRYRLISNMGIVPGYISPLPLNTLPYWLTWKNEYDAQDNPTTDSGAAQITGNAPSQDIEYNYTFTVKAFVDAQEASQYNERDFVITILEDTNCVSPTNNICT